MRKNEKNEKIGTLPPSMLGGLEDLRVQLAKVELDLSRFSDGPEAARYQNGVLIPPTPQHGNRGVPTPYGKFRGLAFLLAVEREVRSIPVEHLDLAVEAGAMWLALRQAGHETPDLPACGVDWSAVRSIAKAKNRRRLADQPADLAGSQDPATNIRQRLDEALEQLEQNATPHRAMIAMKGWSTHRTYELCTQLPYAQGLESSDWRLIKLLVYEDHSGTVGVRTKISIPAEVKPGGRSDVSKDISSSGGLPRVGFLRSDDRHWSVDFCRGLGSLFPTPEDPGFQELTLRVDSEGHDVAIMSSAFLAEAWNLWNPPDIEGRFKWVKGRKVRDRNGSGRAQMHPTPAMMVERLDRIQTSGFTPRELEVLAFWRAKLAELSTACAEEGRQGFRWLDVWVGYDRLAGRFPVTQVRDSFEDFKYMGPWALRTGEIAPTFQEGDPLANTWALRQGRYPLQPDSFQPLVVTAKALAEWDEELYAPEAPPVPRGAVRDRRSEEDRRTDREVAHVAARPSREAVFATQLGSDMFDDFEVEVSTAPPVVVTAIETVPETFEPEVEPEPAPVAVEAEEIETVEPAVEPEPEPTLAGGDVEDAAVPEPPAHDSFEEDLRQAMEGLSATDRMSLLAMQMGEGHMPVRMGVIAKLIGETTAEMTSQFVPPAPYAGDGQEMDDVPADPYAPFSM